MTFFGNSLWGLLKQADGVTLVVLFILFSMSVICWTLFICLAIVMRLKRRSLVNAQAKIKELTSSQEVLVLTTQLSGTVPGYFLSQVLNQLKKQSELWQEARQRDYRSQVEQLERNVDQTIDAIMFHQEAYLPILSTCAAVATLLGLFGTVWGLIHAFLRVSEKQVADITVVAPGIAEALLTTLAGLLVAIPALIMYNYLMVQVRRLEHELFQFADRVAVVLHTLIT